MDNERWDGGCLRQHMSCMTVQLRQDFLSHVTPCSKFNKHLHTNVFEGVFIIILLEQITEKFVKKKSLHL